MNEHKSTQTLKNNAENIRTKYNFNFVYKRITRNKYTLVHFPERTKGKSEVSVRNNLLKSQTKQHIKIKIITYLCLNEDDIRFNVVQLVILKNYHQPIITCLL